MERLHIIILFLVAFAGTGVVATRKPKAQVIVFGFYGLLLSILFFVFKAPDVAFSELVIGSIILPFILLVTLVKIKEDR